MSVNILNSPSDIINYISTFLPAKDILAFSNACKRIFEFLKKSILINDEVYVRALAEKFKNKSIADHIHTKKELLKFCDGLIQFATKNKVNVTLAKGFLCMKHKNHIAAKINMVNSLDFSKISSDSLNIEIIKRIKEGVLTCDYLNLLLNFKSDFNLKSLFKSIVDEVKIINLNPDGVIKENAQKNMKQSIFNICSVLFATRDVKKLFLNLYNNNNLDKVGYTALTGLDFTK
jgi:hypothetical protein